MDGYYSYQPAVTLDRPLCLIGFMGAGVGAVGSTLGALTGLTWIDLDRRVEHAAGRSISHLVLREGLDAWRTIERGELRRALGARPPRIVSLGDGALLDDDNRALVKERAQLVYLRAPVEDLARAVRRELDEQPGRYPTFMQRGAVVTAAALGPLLAAREPGYLDGAVVVDLDRQAPTRVARAVMRAVGLASAVG
jgi:shikimate kinase